MKFNMIEPNYSMGFCSLIFILKLQYFTRMFISKRMGEKHPEKLKECECLITDFFG